MNALGYQISRFARFFGIRRDKQRVATMTRETQFLQEAVDLLGRAAWQDTAGIDDLAVEFWQIRDVENKQKELRREMDRIRGQNEELEQRRAEIEGDFNRRIEKLKESKLDMMSEAVDRVGEIDAMKEDLERLKRRYAGMKLRLRAAEENPGGDDEGTPAEIEESMNRLKQDYGDGQAELEARQAELAKLEAEVEDVNGRLESQRAELKETLSDIVTRIGRGSKELADVSAKIGSLQNSKNALANRIGKYLAQHIENPTPEVLQVLRKHRALTSKILHFRRSIRYQQRLTRR